MRRPAHLLVALTVGLVAAHAVLSGCRGEPQPPPQTSDSNPSGRDEAIPLTELEEQAVRAGAAADLPDPERVVAKVNGTPIPERKVAGIVAVNRLRYQLEGKPVPDGVEKELRRMALQLIIDTDLMTQAAKAKGLKVDPEQLERQIQAAQSNFPSEEEYRQYLQQVNLTEEKVREEATRRLLVEAYIRNVTQGAEVDDSLARELYEMKKDSFKEGDQVKAALILLRSSPDDPQVLRQEVRGKIEEAHRRAVAGEDFGKLAQEYSQGPTAAKGGDLGFFPRGVMVPEFEKMAFETPVGQITPVFETAFGFNVLKILERQEAEPRSFEEVKPWIMLVLQKEQEGRVLGTKLLELRARAKIEILDPGYLPEKAEGAPGPAS